MCVLVGVVLEGALAVCGLELRLGSVGRAAEGVVEFGVLDHDCGLWGVRRRKWCGRCMSVIRSALEGRRECGGVGEEE